MSANESVADNATEGLLAKPELWASPDLPFLPYGLSAKKLGQYVDLLLKWNKSLNLCGCHTALEVLQRLLQDSFFLASFLDSLCHKENPEIWDLGAGAGLPGVPLRIFWEKGSYTWVEARRKRYLFLQTVQARLQLAAFKGYAGRVEAFFQTTPYLADIIVSRAFLPWPELLELCKPYLDRKGNVIIMANTPPPQFADNWRLAGISRYTIQNRHRFLWAVAQA